VEGSNSTNTKADIYKDCSNLYANVKKSKEISTKNGCEKAKGAGGENSFRTRL
jgi:hypothetical protein